ncbi:hypothetical protein, partial [Klebsiella pneumoniae]|uniref:hypothetical protein n=1 Tax=Klebsiella pneumoniae TaxID=573 RepID=UPI00216459A5
VNMAVANGVSSIGSLFSFGASSAATASGGTAIQNAGANFTFNAKGNVYDSPSLSAYSNGVFQTPQLFAFAKGAGIFGEAGPELRRYQYSGRFSTGVQSGYCRSSRQAA